jgi:hypothetical protein
MKPLALVISIATLFLAALACTPVAAADAQPILKMGTESSTKGLDVPPSRVVDAIIGSLNKDDIAELDQCIEDQNLKPHDYRQLLRSSLFKPAAGHLLYFVRGSDAYCTGLYGAHSFQYFLVEEIKDHGRTIYKIVFENRGDLFAVYPEVAHGLNDIEPGGCIVSECRSARMSFDGRKYRPVRCARTTFDRNREVTEPRRCGSDDWRDDQSSGFAPAPKK